MQYSFPEQASAVAEHLQDTLPFVSQNIPLDGSEHDSKYSEHLHSPMIGSQYDPLVLDSQESACPHLQTPSMQDSPSTLHVVKSTPPHGISIIKYCICMIWNHCKTDLATKIIAALTRFLENVPFLCQVLLFPQLTVLSRLWMPIEFVSRLDVMVVSCITYV